MLDLIACLAVKMLYLIFRVIPTWIALKLGRRIGALISLVYSPRRSIGYANLRAAFCAQKSPAQIREMLRDTYKRLAETFMEILCLTKVNRKYVDKYITIENPDHFYEAKNRNKGMIYLTAHFGNWELSGMVSALMGYPLYVLAREQKMKRLNALINGLRESKGLKVVTKGITTRYIARALHEGKLVGMVADQDVGKNGVITNFFGRPVSTADGPYRFAAKTDAAILPVFMARIKGPYHRLVIGKPITIGKKEDPKPYIQLYNKTLESFATRYSDQWLWLHRRWKSSPLKKIVVLSDGKKGHLNQSLSVVESFKKYRQDRGGSPENTKVEIIEIRFKNKFFKNLLNLTSIVSGPWCQGCMQCLKRCLTKASYKRLERNYADVVISTGFSLAGVNSIYKYENNAKNAVCMKPGFLGVNKFNMVLLPWHDVRKSMGRDNVIITETTPNLMNNGYLDKAKKTFSKMIKKSKPRTIGVLFGGDNANFKYDERGTSKAIAQVIEASEKLDADILFTTSRRTSQKIEDVVKKRLGKEPRCKFLVIANEKNVPDAVGGILALSDIIVVSGESASMVSESVAAGKKTVVFKGFKKSNKVTKHEVFLNRLLDAGYLSIAKPTDLSEAICSIKAKIENSDMTNDKNWIYRNMWRLGG
ncbi:MAG: mitochondrial fission ELM1 family protein [Candidatus Omnitrophica bacterium]|nr:mitochondrial fission ELM1 family protein [Candidatus Omnitrophota bacterium]